MVFPASDEILHKFGESPLSFEGSLELDPVINRRGKRNVELRQAIEHGARFGKLVVRQRENSFAVFLLALPHSLHPSGCLGIGTEPLL